MNTNTTQTTDNELKTTTINTIRTYNKDNHNKHDTNKQQRH